MNKTLICLCLLCLLVLENVFAQSCTDNRYIDEIFLNLDEQTNINFANAPALVYPPYVSETTTYDRDLNFNLYQPANDTLTKRPLIIMAFGGAFLVGFKEQPQLVDFCRAMARRGYVVASIDYRLGHNLTEGTAIRSVYRGVQDVKAAIRYFKANAATYNIDTNWVYTGGNSAGSISSIHASYVEESEILGLPLFEDVYGGGLFNNWPNLGCLECSGNSYNTSGEAKALINFWGAIADLDFINSPNDQPMISFHGLNDDLVSPYSANPFNYPFFPVLHGSVPMHDLLDQNGVVNELNVYPGEGHELWTNSSIAEEMQVKTAAFLYDLKKPAPLNIVGPNSVCQDYVATYTVEDRAGSYYCWQVSGGQIVSTAADQNSISIAWDTPGNYSLSVREVNCNVVEGDLVSINVDVATCRVEPRVLLEGPYVGSGLMNTTLNAGGLLPGTQPFNTAPWNYTGTESLASIPADMTDWVLVEILDGNGNVIFTEAAMLYKDGRIYGRVGQAGIEIRQALQPGTFQVVVKTRGHLAVLSNPLTFGISPTVYDFSTASTQAQGSNQQIALSAGVFGLKAGDFDSNGLMSYDDFNRYLSTASSILQYKDVDVNLDGHVTVADYNLYKKNYTSIGLPEIQYP